MGSLSPGQSVSHYDILSLLGVGGMGEVYRARDTRLNREVALKLLTSGREDVLRRFRREARALAAVNHPSITTIHAVEDWEGLHFIVMELVEGSRLDDLIFGEGLDTGRLLEIAVPLCFAVGAAHERGIVHRDLKPANVIVTAEGAVKILDFGLSKLQEGAARPAGATTRSLEQKTAAASAEPITQAGLMMGTVPYMSPEQVQAGTADPRSDIFALGILLFEMATGRRPFTGENAMALASSILRDEPPSVGDLRPDHPPRLSEVVQRCLAKDPRERWQSAGELARALETISTARVAVSASARSVAVLPFIDRSPAQDQRFFCDGIAEELIHALHHLRGLRVASRASSFSYRGERLDPRDVGRALGVTSVLTGSVRKSEERLKVNVELTSVEDGYALWSESYDRRLEDVFAIQEEIARNTVEALEVVLSPGERRAIATARTHDVSAYEYYLRGRQFFQQFSSRAMEFALRLFHQAIEVDPDFALAHAGIADCCSFLYANAGPRPEHLRCALEASERALGCGPSLVEAWVARGVALSLDRRIEDADQAFLAALQINPRHFEANYFFARHCFTKGSPRDAVRFYQRARELRPENYQAPLLMAQILEDLGRPEEARDARRQGVAVAGEHLKLHPDDTRALYMGANGLVGLGETERGLEWARRARKLDPEDPMLLYNLGCIYAMAGESEEALGCLENAVALGFANADWLGHDNNLDSLRALPRFQALLSDSTSAPAGT